MFRHLLFALVVAGAAARPAQIEDDEYDSFERLQKQFNLAAFVDNFKATMTTYVGAIYKHLSVDELERVMKLLDGFLQRFVDDLKEILYHEDYRRLRDVEKIDDDMSKELYDDIRDKVKEEFKGTDDEMADEIVFRLRKNLVTTKQTLDQVIDENMKAHIKNLTTTTTTTTTTS